jgi:uncharacterized protein (TIGR02246 family)
LRDGHAFDSYFEGDRDVLTLATTSSDERVLWRFLVLLIALGTVVCTQPLFAADGDEQRKVMEAIDAAWNAGDIQAMVDLHTEDAEYINAGSGHYWRGRDEMLRGWTAVRATSGPLPLPRTRNVRQLTSDTAVIVSIYEAGPPDARGSLLFIASNVVVRRGDKWLIGHGQGTMAQASTR